MKSARMKKAKAPAISSAALQKKLRGEILAKVRRYATLANAPRKFKPGVDRVHYAGRVFGHEESVSVVHAALDGWMTLGPYGRRLEAELGKYLGVKHVILVNSGSSANLVAVAALCSPLRPDALRPGDEVITPAVTFPTTLAPLLQYQLTPVFVDSVLGTYNIDTARVEEAVSPKTRAIMIPHTLGNPCALDEITRVAERHRLILIEDNCDALGARYRNRLTGTFGSIATLSFYPAHHMTMGEGGAVATNDHHLAKIARSLRDWGRDCWCDADTGPDGACKNRLNYRIEGLAEVYDHRYAYTSIGYNLKPTDLQAALGLAQIKKVPRFIAARNRNFRALWRGLAGYAPWLILPTAEANSEPAWFAFPITVKEAAGFSRHDLTSWLESRHIETRLLFAGNITRQPAYRAAPGRIPHDLACADAVMQRTFFIGVYPGLTPAQLAYVLAAFAEFFKGRKT